MDGTGDGWDGTDRSAMLFSPMTIRDEVTHHCFVYII